jgi:hypothetical protein
MLSPDFFDYDTGRDRPTWDGIYTKAVFDRWRNAPCKHAPSQLANEAHKQEFDLNTLIEDIADVKSSDSCVLNNLHGSS